MLTTQIEIDHSTGNIPKLPEDQSVHGEKQIYILFINRMVGKTAACSYTLSQQTLRRDDTHRTMQRSDLLLVPGSLHLNR